MTKDIEEGKELLVWYDDDTYLQFMGIPIAVKNQAESKAPQHNDNVEREENMFNLEKESMYTCVMSIFQCFIFFYLI